MLFDEWFICELMICGFYIGQFDGVVGCKFYDVFEVFQVVNLLRVSGFVDFVIVFVFQGVKLIKLVQILMFDLVWFCEVCCFMGFKEIVGFVFNLIIMGWVKKFGGWIVNVYSNDDIFWCGLFVVNIVVMILLKESLLVNLLLVFVWIKFGCWCNLGVGVIMIFMCQGGGYVGFYVGEDDWVFYIFGGN